MAIIIQTRRDTAANWVTCNPVLASGEPGLETDTNKLKYGDGVAAWNDLPYFAGGTSQTSYLLWDIINQSAVWISGLTHYLSASYYYNGTFYDVAGEVTNDAADPSLHRIDVIYIDSTGNYGIIKGTPGVNPVKPSIDPVTQYELTIVLIEAGQTTPTGISNEVIYRENTEWATSGTANFDDTTFPYEGTKDAAVAAFATAQNLTFTDSAKNSFSNYPSSHLRNHTHF